jgi:TonB family protein
MKKKFFIFVSFVVLLLSFAVFASGQTVSKKLKIIKKPFPRFSKECGNSYGTTLVRVTFDKAGKITGAEIAQTSTCTAFDDNALDAARRIIFEPQEVDGEPVTVTKIVEYKFNTY